MEKGKRRFDLSTTLCHTSSTFRLFESQQLSSYWEKNLKLRTLSFKVSNMHQQTSNSSCCVTVFLFYRICHLLKLHIGSAYTNHVSQDTSRCLSGKFFKIKLGCRIWYNYYPNFISFMTHTSHYTALWIKALLSQGQTGQSPPIREAPKLKIRYFYLKMRINWGYKNFMGGGGGVPTGSILQGLTYG